MGYNATVHLLPQDSSYDEGEYVLTQTYPSRGTHIYSHDDAVAIGNRSKSSGGNPRIILWGGRSRFNADQLHVLELSGIELESRQFPGQPGDEPELVAAWMFDPPMDGSGWVTQAWGQQQVQAGWELSHLTGHNAIGDPTYDWGMPEALYRWGAFLPPHEWEQFLNDALPEGRCYKIFAMQRPWDATMKAPELSLTNGVYRVELTYADDCYDGMNGDDKVAPADPLSFEVRVGLGNQWGEWHLSDFLQKNVMAADFVHYGGTVAPKFEFRARWGIINPCAFVQKLALIRVG